MRDDKADVKKKERLAAALKANLQRRKAQVRQRTAQAASEGAEAGDYPQAGAQPDRKKEPGPGRP